MATIFMKPANANQRAGAQGFPGIETCADGMCQLGSSFPIMLHFICLNTNQASARLLGSDRLRKTKTWLLACPVSRLPSCRSSPADTQHTRAGRVLKSREGLLQAWDREAA